MKLQYNLEISNQYIKIISAENIAEVIKLKMMKKTPGKFMLGIGVAAAAVAMAPVVRSMINNKSTNEKLHSSDTNFDNYSLH